MPQPNRNGQHPSVAFLTIDDLSGNGQVDFIHHFNFFEKAENLD
jgi:hypothetical protein